MSSTTKLISEPSENTGPALMGIAVLFTSLAIITVAMRIWVRATMVGKVGWDVSKSIMALISTMTLLMRWKQDWVICLTALISIVGMGEVSKCLLVARLVFRSFLP